MKWVNILHLYQPPTQTKEIVDAVAAESYKKIIWLLDTFPKLKLTINISGSLLELLVKYGHEEIIKNLRKHAERGSIEFLGSAMYHPILPLLSEKEILRQIDLNNAISKRYFGSSFGPTGFYLPEMAYDSKSALAIEKAGFKWIVLDEIHTRENIDFAKGYRVAGSELGVIFRNSSFSRTFPPEFIILNGSKLNGEYLITCHDGELYGHWHKDDRGYYKKAFGNENIETILASDYLSRLETQKEIKIRDASWESKPEELEKDIPHGLWNDPRNQIHASMEKFKRNVLTTVENHQNDPGYSSARHHADRGVASCAWWWASEVKIGFFSPVSWNPTEIEKGAKELYMAATSLSTLSKSEMAVINEEFKNLKSLIWTKHKEKYDPNYPINNI